MTSATSLDFGKAQANADDEDSTPAMTDPIKAAAGVTTRSGLHLPSPKPHSHRTTTCFELILDALHPLTLIYLFYIFYTR